MNVEVTRKVTLHLTDSGRDSMRSLCGRLKMLVEMYENMNAPEIANMAEGLRGFIEPTGDG